MPAPDISRRVLHVLGAFGSGGAETWLRGAAEQAAARGWEFEFCLLAPTEGRHATELRARGFAVHRCPLEPRATFPGRFVKLLKQRGRPLVHSHVMLASGLILTLARAARVRGRIAHFHNSDDGRGQSLLRRGYRRAMRGLLAASGGVRLGCSPPAVSFAGAARLHPYSIDLRRFLEAPLPALRAETGFNRDDFVIGHVGRAVPQKNQSFLLRAFQEAHRLDGRLRLALVGDGPLRPALEAEACRLSIHKHVRFLGERNDVRELCLGLFNAFVLPSLWEGLPLALLEAQAAGLPCLVSDRIDPLALAVVELCRAVPLDDSPAAFGRALRGLSGRRRLAPKESCTVLSAAGFSLEDAAERLTAVYEELSPGRAAA